MQHSRLHHGTPGWVPSGARFHIRIRKEPEGLPLTTTAVGASLTKSVVHYHEHGRWYAWLMVLMPDHLHAILSFSEENRMSRIVGEWKKYHTTTSGVSWQGNYFDHRLRSEKEFIEKAEYIRMNPVRKGLCEKPEDWPWVVEPWKM